MKLTAQFVARNGAMFLDKLMMREQRNYQFDFLRKQHPLFSYFTKLVEQYSRVMLPPKDLDNRLRDDVERPVAVSQNSLVIGLVKGRKACRERARALQLIDDLYQKGLPLP